MAKKSPFPHYKHFADAFWLTMRYREDVQFNVPLTAANYTNSLFAGKWGHWNDMYIGTTSPNGYVLGNPIPELAGRTFSLTGTDAARFSVGSSTGIITLANNSGLTVGTLSINLVASDLGSFAISVPVVSSASSIMFIDQENGNDANSGREPHLPKVTYDPVAMSYPTVRCFKRGTTTTLNVPMDFGNNSVFKGYGNPSLDKWKLSTGGGYLHQIRNALKANGVDQQGCSNVSIYDCEFLGGATIQRNIDAYNVQELNVMRCYFDGNIDHSNSNGISVYGGCTNFVGKWNESSHTLYGDGMYIKQTNGYTVMFNYFGTPNGGNADCFQATDENSLNQRCFDGYVAYNIAMFLGNSSSSGKGGFVVGGTDYVTIEHNFVARGNYFGIGTGSAHCIIRHNYTYDCYRRPTIWNENGIGLAADTPVLAVDIYDNYCLLSARTLSISDNGTAFKRDDIYVNGNTFGIGSMRPVRRTTANTLDMQYNIFCAHPNNTVDTVGNGSVVSTNSGTISAFTSGGDGTGYFTTSTGAGSHTFTGDTVTVTTAGVPVDYTVTGRGNGTRIYVVSGMATDTTARTWERKKRYAGHTIANNIEQLALGTGLTAMPTLSGTCQDGQTITATYIVPAGHTVTREWLINGRPISGQTGTTLSIPALSSATTDINGCRTGAASNTAKLSFRLCVIDPNGIKSYVMGIWPDKQVYKTIVA